MINKEILEVIDKNVKAYRYRCCSEIIDGETAQLSVRATPYNYSRRARLYVMYNNLYIIRRSGATLMVRQYDLITIPLCYPDLLSQTTDAVLSHLYPIRYAKKNRIIKLLKAWCWWCE